MSLLGMARLSGLFSRERHCDRGVFVVLDISPLPPCPPSLHRVLLHGFIATMRTLTPVEPLPTCRSRFVVRVLNTRQVSLLIAFELPTIPSSTTASPFLHDRFSTLHHRHGLLASIPRGDPVGQGICPSRESRVRLLPGSSPTGLAVSGSLVLRTGRSSQVALHLSSWKRSYHCRLQAGNVSLGRTSTLLFKRLHRRTSPVAPSTGKPMNARFIRRCRSEIRIGFIRRLLSAIRLCQPNATRMRRSDRKMRDKTWLPTCSRPDGVSRLRQSFFSCLRAFASAFTYSTGSISFGHHLGRSV